MKRRVQLIVLFCIVVIALTGCGGKEQSNTDTNEIRNELVDTSTIEMKHLDLGGFNFDFPSSSEVNSDGNSATYYIDKEENRKTWLYLSYGTNNIYNASNMSDEDVQVMVNDYSKGLEKKGYEVNVTSQSYNESDQYSKVLINSELDNNAEKIYVDSYFLLNKDYGTMVMLSYCSKDQNMPYLDFFENIVRDVSVDTSVVSNDNASSQEEVDPDLKAFLDSYETFVDEYVAFMEKYQNNPTDMSLLNDYSSYMTQYSQMTTELNTWSSKQNQMTEANLNYYLDVTSRCSQKLSEVALSYTN